MNVVDPSNLIDQQLHARLCVCVARPLLLLVNNQDVTGIGLGHYLDRMSRDDTLSEPRPRQSKQLPLEVGMHVNIRFIESDGAVGGRSRKKPDCLQPHLKSMAHPPDFCDKIAVTNGQ